MFLYYLTIAFQVFCIYHAYKNKSNYYWYFIIFFIPLLGSIVYLFINVFNKRDIETISDEITTIINPTKKIKDLEKLLEFSDTFQNKVNLGDAYLENKDFKSAIDIYEKALLNNNFKNDPHTINKLVYCYFNMDNFEKVIENSNKIDLKAEFLNTSFYHGLALEKTGKIDEAESFLKKIDKRYTNYEERPELSRFLIRRNKKSEAKELIEEIISEIKSMQKPNFVKHRFFLTKAHKILDEL
ncbi:MAG: CDC27 family protein [Polaribacter sp.]|uniref:CDC27 family protein n=1 Tax=Polaribacter sp. TaxID=1920175 RepID=UPI003BB05B5F